MLTLKLITEETERVIRGLEKNISREPKKPLTKYSLLTNSAARLSRNLTRTCQKLRRWQLRLVV